jgi:hypothetical protein
VAERTGEEPASGREIPLLRDEDIDDLPELVDRPVQVDSTSRDFDVGLIHEPPITGDVSARSCSVDEQRSEPRHPPIDGHMINLDATLGQQLLNVSIGQSIPEVPAHRRHDHIWWEPETGEAGPGH